jgi:hypothetical protein
MCDNLTTETKVERRKSSALIGIYGVQKTQGSNTLLVVVVLLLSGSPAPQYSWKADLHITHWLQVPPTNLSPKSIHVEQRHNARHPRPTRRKVVYVEESRSRGLVADCPGLKIIIVSPAVSSMSRSDATTSGWRPIRGS